MSVRTTASAAQVLVEDCNTALDWTPFLVTASNVVDWLVLEDMTSQLDTTTQELIERWLTAHFYGQFDRQMAYRSTGQASGQYMGQTTMSFLGTPWGQVACDLDRTGRLAQRAKDTAEGRRRVAGLTWNGTCYESVLGTGLSGLSTLSW